MLRLAAAEWGMGVLPVILAAWSFAFGPFGLSGFRGRSAYLACGESAGARLGER
jgi:hypothetical protein